ncbi:amidase-domain-containing protein [Dactylonectria estremocensis]|uniref:Amidase-domain-containing protein n=1 Tax=Dactylonectria estremocensis TaxID=1079267 RepID=A0A9P9EMC6_9HYPO|nr:amidase-domain-containing protein [Dactylonectria estremocensis]
MRKPAGTTQLNLCKKLSRNWKAMYSPTWNITASKYKVAVISLVRLYTTFRTLFRYQRSMMDAIHQQTRNGRLQRRKDTAEARRSAVSDSNNFVFWQCVNPLNRRLILGGSSGGEGTMVGTRGSPLGIGTNIGGSTCIPAALCCLNGLSPTHSRHPYERGGNFCLDRWKNAKQCQLGFDRKI